MRPPVGRDLRALKLSSLADLSFDEAMDLAGKLAGRNPDFMDLLDSQDVIAAITAAMDFLSGKG